MARAKKNGRCTRTRKEPGKNTRWKDSCKRDMERVGRRRKYLTGQGGREKFITIQATPRDGKRLRMRKRRREETPFRLIQNFE